MKIRRLKYFLLITLLLPAAFVSFGQKVREVPDSVVQRMKSDKDFGYANDPAFWARSKPSDAPAFIRALVRILASDLLKWILYALLAAVLAFVVYKIIIANNFFARGRRAGRRGEHQAGETDIPENIDDRLNAAVAAGEYRLAVRYHYLKTLTLLSDQNKIKLRAKSTNNEYVRQMQALPQGNDFRLLTGIYEYVWYGEFKPDAGQFELIRNRFNLFNG